MSFRKAPKRRYSTVTQPRKASLHFALDSQTAITSLRTTIPFDENVTVISGTFKLGMGETADQSKVVALPAGSFFSLHPGMNHFVYADGETVIQINTVGPWDLEYVNPEDDPRKRM